MSKTKKPDLPPGVTTTDTSYPETGTGLTHQKVRELGLNYEDGWTGSFHFYQVDGRHAPGWVLTTLLISKPGRYSKGQTARTYSIGVTNQKVYTVGRGPHVTGEVTVYLSTENLDRLKGYIDLWKKGMADAQSIRDRISSRRAQGTLRRGGLPPW